MSLKNFDFFAVYFYFITLTIEAPLRVALETIGLSPLIYIREVFLVVAIFLHLFQSHLDSKVIYLLLGFVFFLLEGIFFTENIFQVMASLKSFLPFILGFLMMKKYQKQCFELRELYLFVFFTTALGLALDYMFDDLPWKTLSIDIAGVSVEEQAGLITFDGDTVSRPSGFMRLHNVAATVMSYAVGWAIAYRTHRVLWAIAGVVFVSLTTAKAPIVVMLAVCFIMIIGSFFQQKGQGYLLKGMALFFMVLMIGLPLLSLVFGSISNQLDTEMMLFLFASFDDRLINSWPRSIEMVTNYGNVFLGRGIGGIGYVITLFDKFVHNPTPVDNFFVTAYGLVGVFAFFGFLFLLYQMLIRKIRTEWDMFMLILFVMIIGNGIMNDMTDQMTMLHFGLLTRYLLEKRYDDVNAKNYTSERGGQIG